MNHDLFRAYAWFRLHFRDHGTANRLAHVAVRYWAGEIAG